MKAWKDFSYSSSNQILPQLYKRSNKVLNLGVDRQRFEDYGDSNKYQEVYSSRCSRPVRVGVQKDAPCATVENPIF